MRKIIVAANWKMNKDLQEGYDFVEQLKAKVQSPSCGVVLNVPYIHLAGIGDLLSGSSISLGAQNIHQESHGAYTGEISGAMIKSVGASHVIVGHSERRAYFGETDEVVLQKVKAALEQGLTPIYCCGEPLEIRDSNEHIAYVHSQLAHSIFQLKEEELRKIIIAYEPIWAIGTGRTASSDQAQEMHAAIRRLIQTKFNNELADQISILYGGSCKPSNAEELFSLADVDGGLIGGASLEVDDFFALIQIAEKLS